MDTRRHSQLRGWGAPTVGLLLALASPASAQFAGFPSLADVNAAGVTANADSSSVATSADGTLVAFVSDADNLVPLDTNGDSDVFLHDSVTGITTRVSVNFQGEEAMGDSMCPSMSADGRYVAFLSRAWNLVQGGEDVGPQVWNAYVRDRQGPTTIRVSEPIGGGPSEEDISCPIISADGTRVAFTSLNANLVPDDTNARSDVFVYDIPTGSMMRASVADDGTQANLPSYEPSLSADGTVVAFFSFATNLTADLGARPQIYVRDLVAETTELVSRARAAPFGRPNDQSIDPQISADGTVVLFRSRASDLTPDKTTQDDRFFVHDRVTGVTEAVEPLSLGAGPCGWLSDPLVCDLSDTRGAALSADGRFVAFLSGSLYLLPESQRQTARLQLYVQDRLTRRLRRVTVDPTGYPASAYPCGGSSDTLALSADGQVLVFVAEHAEQLGFVQPSGVAERDVVRLEWPCDPVSGSCREASLCPGTPAPGCQPANASRLRIRKNPPLAARRERFYWRWVGAGDGLDFVDPTADGEYHLCVYAGESLNAQLDAGIPKGEPWKRLSKGWKRREPRGAVELVQLRDGDARSMITVATSSPALDLPYLPLETPHGVTVQLFESTTEKCWEAVFGEEDLRVNRRGEIRAEGTLPGRVSADVR